MGALSRTKGHSYERAIAKAFRDHGFPEAGRHLEYQTDEANGVDLKNTGPYLVQCKRGRAYAPITAIEEISGEGVPLLVTKADNKPDMVVMPLAEFLRLVRNARPIT